MTAVYACAARKAVIYKASQMGASEYAISYVLHACDQRKMTMLYVFPTDTHVSDFSSARIGSALEASPYLSSIVTDGGGRDGKRGADRVTLKRIRDRFLYLRGAKVSPTGEAAQLKSIDADGLVIDEQDEMDRRAPEIAYKRLGHSEVGEIRNISTPTYPGRGIHAEWLLSDMREWFVPCPSCGTWQFMTIKHVVTEWDDLERPIAWHGMKDNTAWVACAKCHKKMNRMADGVWVAAHPEREVAGFHLTKLFSPTANLLEIVRTLQSVNETKRRECFNQDLGQPYEAKGEQITDSMLDHCIRDYAPGFVKGERPFVGVDVGSVLSVIIRAPLQADGTRPLRLAVELDGVDKWAELYVLLKMSNFQTCVIDVGPETTKAREFQAQFPDEQVWLARYVEGDQEERNAEPVRWEKKDGIVLMDRTRTLDVMTARFKMQINTLPANAAHIAHYYDQLKEQKRITDDPVDRGKSGKAVIRYINEKPDHYAHAENYVLAAAMKEYWGMW